MSDVPHVADVVGREPALTNLGVGVVGDDGRGGGVDHGEKQRPMALAARWLDTAAEGRQ